jgi:hypothetical protein
MNECVFAFEAFIQTQPNVQMKRILRLESDVLRQGKILKWDTILKDSE